MGYFDFKNGTDDLRPTLLKTQHVSWLHLQYFFSAPIGVEIDLWVFSFLILTIVELVKSKELVV